jgi:hypothetical protein
VGGRRGSDGESGRGGARGTAGVRGVSSSGCRGEPIGGKRGDSDASAAGQQMQTVPHEFAPTHLSADALRAAQTERGRNKRAAGGAVLGAMHGESKDTIRLVRGATEHATAKVASEHCMGSPHGMAIPARGQYLAPFPSSPHHANLDQQRSASYELQTYAVPHAGRSQQLCVPQSAPQHDLALSEPSRSLASTHSMLSNCRGQADSYRESAAQAAAVDSASAELADLFVSDREWPFSAHDTCNDQDTQEDGGSEVRARPSPAPAF